MYVCCGGGSLSYRALLRSEWGVVGAGVTGELGSGRVSSAFAGTVFLALSKKFRSTCACLYHKGIFTGTRAKGVILVDARFFRKRFKLVLRCLVPMVSFVFKVYITRVRRVFFGGCGGVR